jgi:myo-inositol-1(or 4)-monophosphatase
MDWTKERDVLQQAVRTAGQVIWRMAQAGFETAHKANQDPVTTADLESNRILKEALLTHFPNDGWLSEETRDDPARLTKERVWIVDPIDGTKEFVTGIPEFVVSVALVEQGLPVLSAVYNPATDELCTAIKGQGAWYNGTRAKAGHTLTPRPVILASRSEIKRGEFKPFETRAEIRPVGSIAYKLALIAAGQADATFSLGPKNEWDIAAGVLLVQEAEGKVCDQTGLSFLFNQRQTLVNGIVATTAQAYETVRRLIESVTSKR